MEAKRIKPKQKFVPVIVILESQEEVDALYAIINHTAIVSIFPALNGWQLKLKSFRGVNYQLLHKKLEKFIYGND